jgi:hypothetical protein
MASNISHDRELVPSSSSTPARNHSLPTSGPRHDRPPRLSQTRGNIQTAAARTHQTGLGSQIPRSNPRRPRSGLCHPPAPTTATIGGTPSHALSAMGRPLLARNSFLAVPLPQRPWDRASAPLHFTLPLPAPPSSPSSSAPPSPPPCADERLRACAAGLCEHPCRIQYSDGCGLRALPYPKPLE